MSGLLRAFADGLAGRKPEPVPVPAPKGCPECGLLFARYQK